MDMHEIRTALRGALPRQRIAVVGSGISGLAVAWLLAKHHEVTLYEADSRAGGHTHTVDVTLEGKTIGVDTGFLVFNERTYPELCGLFDHLALPLAESEMTFAVSLASGALEWAGTSLGSVFAQKRNLLRPSFWGMLRDILRFNREATTLAAQAVVTPSALVDETVGEFLQRRGYGRAFRDDYLLPMAASIWSCPTQQMLAYPLATFVRFCHNHGLLQVQDRPRWRTVAGGARRYVERMLVDLAPVATLRLGVPVRSVRRSAAGVEVLTDGDISGYDALVLACHSDQAHVLLGTAASVAEQQILGAIRYQPNRAVLHTDTRLLPQRRSVWSAWNYLAGQGAPDTRPVSVTYLLNRLQPLPFATPLMVTLNPHVAPAAEHVLREISYAHPMFDGPAIAAQTRLGEIQGTDKVWFCGAWTGYGFHEDGLRSAIAVAAAFGVAPPWQARTTRPAAQHSGVVI